MPDLLDRPINEPDTSPRPVTLRAYVHANPDAAERITRRVFAANLDTLQEQFADYCTNGTPMRPDLARDEAESLLSKHAMARGVTID